MSEYKISAPLRNLITFNGSEGKPLLVIDGEKRCIEVSEGVDVSEAAQAVLTAIERLLPFARQELATIRTEALEDAARVCDEPARRLREERGWSAEAELLERYAAAIRALKDRGDE